jgi:polyhydroxyalkanoate synthesis regulator phasin
MLQRIMDWMVERAMPPFIEDPAEQRIAEEAAESGIRQTTRLAGIAGGILFVVMAAMLYMYLPSQQISLAPSESTRAAPEPEAENDANLHQPSEDMLGKLDGVTKERDTLQGKLTVLEGQVAELTSKLQAAKALAASKLHQPSEELQKKLDGVTKERDTLQGKMTDLEGQVAELNGKLQTAKVLAARKHTPQPPRQATSPARTPVLASRPGTYQCGDGRTVRNPAACKPANASAPGVLPSPPSAYQCGDGRTVRNPAECKPAAGAAPGG